MYVYKKHFVKSESEDIDELIEFINQSYKDERFNFIKIFSNYQTDERIIHEILFPPINDHINTKYIKKFIDCMINIEAFDDIINIDDKILKLIQFYSEASYDSDVDKFALGCQILTLFVLCDKELLSFIFKYCFVGNEEEITFKKRTEICESIFHFVRCILFYKDDSKSGNLCKSEVFLNFYREYFDGYESLKNDEDIISGELNVIEYLPIK